jgi:hypothetical protein
LLRHGAGKMLTIDETYPPAPVVVPCPPALLVQAALQLLLAARGAGSLAVAVADRTLSVSPAPADSLATRIAERIITDHGGTLERDAGSLAARWER